MPELLNNPVILILSISTVIASLFYLREYNRRKKSESQTDRFLQDLQQKGYASLHDSIKKSREILTEAELEGVKAVAESKIQTSKLEDQYQRELADIMKSSQETITKSQTEVVRFIQGLAKRGQDFEMASQRSVQQRINQMFDNLEQRLADFLLSTEQKSVSSIELEIKGARQLVESYKAQQLKLIDENIIAMMEQTLSLVLSKKLSLKEQLDLIYEALEKAKVDKFVV